MKKTKTKNLFERQKIIQTNKKISHVTVVKMNYLNITGSKIN